MPRVGSHLIHSPSIQIYNGLDACITHEVRSKLAEIPDDNVIYNFELALQAPVLEMMQRGIRVDPFAREDALQLINLKLDRLDYMLEKWTGAVWDRKLTRKKDDPSDEVGHYTFPNSPKQLQEFFYDCMGIRKIAHYAGGEVTYPMDRDTLEKIADHYLARPIVAVILAIRDLRKEKEILTKEIDPDWKWRQSINIAGTKTGRFCLSGDTEILTRNEGWIPLNSFEGIVEAAVWHPNGEIKFEACNHLRFENYKPLIIAENTRIHAAMTDEHRIPYFTTKDILHTAKAKEKKRLHAVPISGTLEHSLFCNEYETRACVMMQADGTNARENLITFGFKKSRKIERCQFILDQAKISYRMSTGINGVTHFYLYNPPRWLVEAKYFGVWVLQHDPSYFISEIAHWDSSVDPKNGAIEYVSTIRENAEWVCTMAHLANCSARIRERQRDEENWKDSFRVWIGSTTNTRLHEFEYSVGPIEKEVFCLQTRSGFFLIRSKGKISITGNSSSKSTTGTGSNTQNLSPELRHVFTVDDGWKIAGIDKEQAEAREVGYICGVLFNDWTYLDVCESQDLHTTVCMMVWENDYPWTEDMKENRKIAEREIFYRHYTLRETVKRLGHGSTYGGLPPTLSSHTNIPVPMCASFQDRFFTRFPGIPHYHQWVAQELQTKGYLINRFGRRRDFFDRTRDRETINSGVAFLPQSQTADDLNLGLWRVWKYMGTRIQLLHQWHDAIYFAYREDDDEQEVLRLAKQYMDVKVTAPNGRKFSVPTDCKIGYNFGARYKQDSSGAYIDANPRGLDKIKVEIASIY